MKFSIYIIRNTINDKVYIGQTVKSIERRFSYHCKAYSQCLKMKNAIAKHGKDNFYVETICQCSSSEVADYLEIDYIKDYDSIENGYNIVAGGHKGLKPMLGKKHTKEACRQMSIARIGNKFALGHKHSDKTKKQMSESHLGNKSNLGNKASESTKRKMSEAHYKINRKLSDEQELSIVKEYAEIKSSRKLGKKYNVNQTTILKILKRHAS